MTLEFTAVRASVAQAVKQAERARMLRIESIDRQLPALEADITTKQQEVAALRAERERLQGQTGAQIVAGMAGDGEGKRDDNQERCHYCRGLFLKPVENHHSEQECAFLTSQIEMGAVNVKQDEPFLPGLPDKRLRDVWPEWEDNDGDVVTFEGEQFRFSNWPSTEEMRPIDLTEQDWNLLRFRPHGATWEHVKRLADEAEKKESGPLKVGDRVEVPEGVRDLVHEGALLPGQYEVKRNWEDGIIRIQRGSVRYLVRDSDVRRV